MKEYLLQLKSTEGNGCEKDTDNRGHKMIKSKMIKKKEKKGNLRQ